MRKHTPGPWVACKPTDALHAVRAPSKHNGLGMIICDAGYGATEEINLANAQLIAAAPDLLEALKRCKFDSLNMSLDDLEFCRAAYLKATGETS